MSKHARATPVPWSRLFTILVLLAVALAPAPKRLGPPAPESHAGIEPYRGLGTWIDAFDSQYWANPAAAILQIKADGVHTLYLQTSSYTQSYSIKDAVATGQFIEEAHAAGLYVVAWYLPGLASVSKDFARCMAAVDFRSPNGQGFDSFGLDIEAAIVHPASLRTARLLKLSSKLRATVGPNYPLGAIIPSPVGIQAIPNYWPGFPYQQLAQYYDVFLPMGYFGCCVHGEQGAHDYTAKNVAIIRQMTGNPSEPIHLIGGIANQLSGAETQGFVDAARENGALGASLYDLSTSGPEDWKQLDQMPANPVQAPPMPLSLGYTGALGNIPGADTSHPKEVFFQAGPLGSSTLSFQAFDIQAGEVTVWVDWRRVGAVASTKTNAWGTTQSMIIPASALSSSGPNYIAFTAMGNSPDWSTWGVRNVSVAPG